MINSISQESLFLEDNLSLMTVSVSDSTSSSSLTEMREKSKLIIESNRNRVCSRIFLIIGILIIIGMCVGLLLLNYVKLF
jgi:hypothetical protein